MPVLIVTMVAQYAIWPSCLHTCSRPSLMMRPVGGRAALVRRKYRLLHQSLVVNIVPKDLRRRTNGASWLSVPGHVKDSLFTIDLFR